MSIFNEGSILFDKFKISMESEIIFSDYCHDTIFMYKHGIKFTDKALLILYPAKKYDDWIEAESIDFSPWDNILGFQNIRGSEIIEEFSHTEIKNWLSTIPNYQIQYPHLYARRGDISYIVQGTPKSARSKKGKGRLKQDVQDRKDIIKQHFGPPATGSIEIMIEVFSSDLNQLPDVDRLSITIMDAFEGTAYINDKQVRQLRPRVFSSTSAYTRLECQTEPVAHFEVENIPAGSLFPLATGIFDYYAVRIITYSS